LSGYTGRVSLKPENMLKRRVQQVKELCHQLNYPFVIGYMFQRGMDDGPGWCNVYGAGSKLDDLQELMATLEDVIMEKFGKPIDSLPTDRQEAMGHVILNDKEACALRGE